MTEKKIKNPFYLSNNDKICIVALYYSKLNSNDEKYNNIGIKLEIASEKLNCKYNTLRNIKDQYDYHFNNGRKGWKNISPKYAEVFEKYKNYSIDELEYIVNSVLHETDENKNYCNNNFQLRAWCLKLNPNVWELKKFEEMINRTNLGYSCTLYWRDSKMNAQIGDRVFWIKLDEEPKGIFASGYVVNVECSDNEDSETKIFEILMTDIIDYRTQPIISYDTLKKYFKGQNWNIKNSYISIKPNIAYNIAKLWKEKMIETDSNTDGIQRTFDFENYSSSVPHLDSYSNTDFFKDVYMNESDYNMLSSLLINKKNIILQGVPGVGKTFSAKRLAYCIMGKKDDSRIEFVQFHQNYSYEDFIMGYRPNENGGFDLKEGIFYKFCKKVEEDSTRDYFFIIDEINRGNMSKIFGELLMMIEKDYRGQEVTLAYNGEKFSVPQNLYIIGMMNTADRSIAIIDYALRRRFSFFEINPKFESEGFTEYQKSLNNAMFDNLINQVKSLNHAIKINLGKNFLIGHSYFCNLKEQDCTIKRLRSIVDYDILPMLSEYWFDDEDKVETWRANLHNALGVKNDE